MTSMIALNHGQQQSAQTLLGDLEGISRDGLDAVDEYGRPRLRRIADLGACTYPSLDLAHAVIRTGHPEIVDRLGRGWQGYLSHGGVTPGSKIFVAAARGPDRHFRTAIALGLDPVLVRRGVLGAALREDDPEKLSFLAETFGPGLLEADDIPLVVARPAPAAAPLVARLLAALPFDARAISVVRVMIQDTPAIYGDGETRRCAAILYRLDRALLPRVFAAGAPPAPGALDRMVRDMGSAHGRLRLETGLPDLEVLLSGSVPA